MGQTASFRRGSATRTLIPHVAPSSAVAPGRPPSLANVLLLQAAGGSRGTRADQGVCPTIASSTEPTPFAKAVKHPSSAAHGR